MIAVIWRTKPPGQRLRSVSLRIRSAISPSSIGKRPPTARPASVPCATIASRSSPRGWRSSSAVVRIVGREQLGCPVVDMIEVSVSTRSRQPAATSCAIIPPIDAPTTCARGIDSASISPTVSAAMSVSV